MILKPFIFVLLFFSCGVTFAQLGASPEKSAFKNIEKHRWAKAETKLRKSLARDTLSPSTRYALSVFYFHRDNPDFHVDSAYHYAVTALDGYVFSPARERERLRRAGIDSLGLITLRARIDSAAFEVARKTNTEAAYLGFLSHFPSAIQRDLAAQLRDEVAYQDALTLNTYEAFYAYLARYPEAQRAPEARTHYHRLLYFAETGDQRLGSYERFLTEHPETPYRSEVYRNIFEISTADGSVDSFLSFMARYPASHLVKSARQMIFHILAEEEDPDWPASFLNDSLQYLLEVNKTYLVPFLKDNLYGFMDEQGMEVLTPQYKSIHPEYLCGRITDETLILDNQLMARNGSSIFAGKITDVTDLGTGFLKVETADGIKIVHKAGFLFADSLEDARVLSHAFIALKKDRNWYLYTLTGRLLDPRPWNDLNAFQDVIVFSAENRKFMVPKDRIGKTADGDPLPLSEPFEEVKQWSRGLIWGKSGAYEGVLNQSLQGVIKFDKHTLHPTAFGAIATIPNGFVLYNASGKKSSTFDQVNILGNQVTVRKNGSWFLYEPVESEIAGKAYDSLLAEGAFVVGMRADTAYVHFKGNYIKPFIHPLKFTFVPGQDSTSFLAVQEAAHEKTVYDLNGSKLFSTTFDALEYAGKGIFVITRKDRKGLLSIRGENLLPAEFDAIGSMKDRVISVLKNRKFGAYSVDRRDFIKPQYDRNLLAYASSFVVTFKDGYYGFLGWDNKPVSGFEFDEVNYWNDSLALVKKGPNWNLYDLSARKMVETNLRSFSLIRNTDEEKIAIIQKDNEFGVISNRKNVVIPATFSDIINLGSAEAPFYFTEKHIPEASLYIVIYYDRSGEMVRKEIYEDATHYDRIYCSDQ